jgi:hypothetical protein
MVTLCWAAKGGSGTTVVASALALTAAQHTLLVDLDGEIPAALGLPEPDRPGVLDWLSSDAPPDHLHDLAIDIDPDVSLLPCAEFARTRTGRAATLDGQRWRVLSTWLSEQSRHGDVIIDAGTGEPHPALVEVADHNLLVTRACYLSLRQARASIRPTGIILVEEPGRTLRARDIERAIGAPVVATVSLDPAIARAVDAGILTMCLPRWVGRQLRRVAA